MLLTIKVREPNKLTSHDASMFISFPFDEYYLNIMRSQPERAWHPKEKEWEIPYDYLGNILDNIKPEDDYDIKISANIKPTLSKVKETIPTNYSFKTEPFKHQLEGIEYGLNHNKFLLGDEQGLGKTKQCIDIACIKKQNQNYKHCLIIACVNSLKYNWQEEIKIHSNETGYILGTRVNKKGRTIIGSNVDKYNDLCELENPNSPIHDNYFIITNIETLRYKAVVEQVVRNGKATRKINTFPIVDELQRLIKLGLINMIVADEVHRCKDSTSQQGKALLALNTETMIALTGTPLMNNPVDLYSPLRWLGFEQHSLYNYKNHYCILGGFGNHQIVGYKNLPELQTKLNTCMLRRLKSDVLDLPDKIYTNEYVEMSKSQTLVYVSVLDEIRANIDKIKLSPNPLTQLIRLRQVTGDPSIISTKSNDNPKLDRMLEIVEDLVENDKKCIVFSNWTSVLNKAYDLLNKHGYQPALYTGENLNQREAEKYRFKNNKDCKVICGTIGAMGTGLTLTEATYVIFLDEPWNRAIKDQCEDRCHRIGTKEPVNIITIMCKDTIDERINELVYKKGKMSDIIVDKSEDIIKNPKVLDFLLS